VRDVSVHQQPQLRAPAQLIRNRARTFSLASLFLPPPVRRDVRIVYGYYRKVDDLVDAPPAGWGRDDTLRALAGWEDAVAGPGAAPEPSAVALRDVVDRYGIPSLYLRMVLDGVRLDLDRRWIETRDELVAYSVLVAGSVGMVMAHILGSPSDGALEAAKSLGVAMQLTNILRDVGEDRNRGFIYLPREELIGTDGALEGLTGRTMTPGLRQVLRDLALCARHHYRAGLDGIHHLHPTNRFAVVLAATLYGRILDKVGDQNRDVFRSRAHLTPRERLALTVPTYFRYRTRA
jgi:15-cis-phytoene synthase